MRRRSVFPWSYAGASYTVRSWITRDDPRVFQLRCKSEYEDRSEFEGALDPEPLWYAIHQKHDITKVPHRRLTLHNAAALHQEVSAIDPFEHHPS